MATLPNKSSSSTTSSSASSSTSAAQAPSIAAQGDDTTADANRSKENHLPLDSSEFAVPPELVPRCLRTYGWKRSFCERAVAAYGQFMALKRLKQDWDGTDLVPPPAIDRVWQQHVLDTNHYEAWCKRTSQNNMIHYRPSDSLVNYDDDEEVEGQLVDRMWHTVSEVEKHFGIDTTDEVWWTFANLVNMKQAGPEDDDDSKKDKEEEEKKLPSRKRRRHSSTSNSRGGTNSSSSSSASSDESDAPSLPNPSHQAALQPSRQPLTIFVRWGQNPDPGRSQDLYFKIRPDTKMQRVFDRYTIYWNDAVANLPAAARAEAENMQDFVFFFGSRMVRPNDTAFSLGLVADDMLYATRCSAVEDDESSPSL